ncbi:conserved hypothetical protein [Trichophyton verrucosum HKI 0517]|uniref:Uncharacterized protein n=1 Tax=Trichophyton verrucosum (strain HKI 0517) TaxID=663202 RepID=D4DA36_TRIVH|nr:uncharacterized protein TRV_03980 [Trichophyton verrucosum HKI 0517]EFE41273.1 conserved hypothetical protein [Trichophyton verrucosum HKI 0517]
MTLDIPPRMSSAGQHHHHHHQDQRQYRQETAIGIIERAFDSFPATPSPDLALWREHKGGLRETEMETDAAPRAESCASDLTGGYSINRTGRLDEEVDIEPVKEHKVRPRLSSPFLRHVTRKTSSNLKQDSLRPSEPSSSSSTSQAVNRSQKSYHTNGTSSQDLALRDYPAGANQSTTDLSTDHNSRGTSSRKAHNKQKHRPPMIDLSKLFPRQRKTPVPCPPSPVRVDTPPSIMSNGSDTSLYKTHKFEKAQRALDRLTTRSPNSGKLDMIQSEYRQEDDLTPVQAPLDRYQSTSSLQEPFNHQKDQSNQQQQKQRQEKDKLAEDTGERLTDRKYEGNWRDFNYKRKKLDSAWYDGVGHHLVDDDMGIQPGDQVEVMYGQLLSRDPAPATRERRSMSLPSRQPSIQSGKPGHGRLAVPNGSTQKPKTSSGSVKSASMANSNSYSSQPSVNTNSRPAGKSDKEEPRIRKKSSRAILNASNLNESSVLCLSSSEDESEDESSDHTTGLRDSITTIDEGFQICTAKAVTTASRPSIKRVRSSSKKHTARSGTSTATRSQNGDTSSRASSLHPSILSPTDSNFSSGRTIPDRLPTSPPTLPRIQTQFSPAESGLSQPGNRRSRVIAVTRQEEYLLELIRRNKGAVPQTLSPDGSASTNTKEWARALAAQMNRRSASSYSSDTSFLRLSPALPPTPLQKRPPRSIPNPSIASTTGDAASSPSVPQSVTSDTSYHTSFQSPPPLPKINLVNSGVCFPSPPSGQSSPFTPPAVPFKHRRHSSRMSHTPSMPSVRESLRNRANTTAIYDDNDDCEKDIETNPDIPIWALGWNSEATGVAIVH